MRYRLFVADDFAALYSIEGVCFARPFRFARRYMRELIESPSSTTWIAEEDGAMAGFGILDCLTDEHGTAAYIQTIEVAPAQRNRGIGSELLACMETSARNASASVIWLHVDAQNEDAIRLYRGHGYRHAGRREHYYARGRAAEIYVRTLNNDGTE